jgi:molybdopterin/thiamine biosynthesis adenylyltransferase
MHSCELPGKEITEDQYYDYLFSRSQLLLTEQMRSTIRNATIAIVGLGGIGCMVSEMMIRMGFSHFKLADIDCFEPTNLNRQLFSDYHNCIGNKRFEFKALIASERLKQINPFCRIEIIEDGIDNLNVEDFCKNCDIIMAQPDREGIKVLLHRMAKKYAIPVITAARTNCSDNRWTLAARVWDYQRNPELKTFEETNHPELLKYRLEELTPQVLAEYHDQDFTKVRSWWRRIIEGRQVIEYGLADLENATQVMESCPNDFHKAHILAPIANIAGAMASIEALKLLLNQETKTYAIDFWSGQFFNV